MELTWISFHGRPIAAAQMAKAGGASLLLGQCQTRMSWVHMKSFFIIYTVVYLLYCL